MEQLGDNKVRNTGTGAREWKKRSPGEIHDLLPRRRMSRPEPKKPSISQGIARSGAPLPLTPHDADTKSQPLSRFYRRKQEPPMSSTPSQELIAMNIAILTVSDTRGESQDSSGQFLEDSVVEAGHILIARRILPDDVYLMRALISSWIADSQVHAVVITGGTGFHERDSTPGPGALAGQNHRRFWRRIPPAVSRRNWYLDHPVSSVWRTGQSYRHILPAWFYRRLSHWLERHSVHPTGQPPQPLQFLRAGRAQAGTGHRTSESSHWQARCALANTLKNKIESALTADPLSDFYA